MNSSIASLSAPVRSSFAQIAPAGVAKRGIRARAHVLAVSAAGIEICPLCLVHLSEGSLARRHEPWKLGLGLALELADPGHEALALHYERRIALGKRLLHHARVAQGVENGDVVPGGFGHRLNFLVIRFDHARNRCR